MSACFTQHHQESCMTTQYAPVFTKDGDQYIVPGPDVASYDTVEQAVAAGIGAQLQSGYGLSPTGQTVAIEDGKYQAPFIIATIADKTAWIIGGPTLDGLTSQRHVAVENLPVAEPDYPEITPTDEDDVNMGS